MFFIQFIAIFSSLASILSSNIVVDQKVKDIVNKYLSVKDTRFNTFSVALQLAIDRKCKIFIETGTSREHSSSCRSDGCSTYIFSEFNQFLNNENVEMYSVDISEKNCKISRDNIKSYGKFAVNVVESDSVKFIQDWPIDKKIDFLYLDSFDFFPGIEIASQQHHFKELNAALNKIHDDTIIFMDDCRLRMGGKCALVRNYLLNNNWKIVIDEYQTLFVKNN